MTDWRPGADAALLRARANLLARLRGWMADHGVMEVETPLLSRHGNTDRHIHSLATESPARWLRTSPEFPMKRLLAAGIGDCYELGRVFRQGESGTWHNPEFSLLEWYRLGIDHQQLMMEVVDLLRHAADGALDAWPLERYRFRDLFGEVLGLDPLLASESDLREAALGHGAEAQLALDRDGWIDYLMATCIQPGFKSGHISLVYDYPASMAALARLLPSSEAGQPPVAARFEVFLGPVELANGYWELQDAEEQARRFEQDRQWRDRHGLPQVPVDQPLLAALAHGLPDCAGVALGVDRLLMVLHGASHIEQVLSFDWQRA